MMKVPQVQKCPFPLVTDSRSEITDHAWRQPDLNRSHSVGFGGRREDGGVCRHVTNEFAASAKLLPEMPAERDGNGIASAVPALEKCGSRGRSAAGGS